MRNDSASSPNAVTLDARPGGSSSVLNDFQPVEFIEGTPPQITTETTSLLRTRLRAAAGFLFLAFALFFAWRLYSGVRVGSSDTFTFYAEFGITVLLGSSFALLCRHCVIPINILRAYELAIFGLPVAYFIVQHHDLLKLAAKEEHMPTLLGPWLGTVFTYALFIPNTWRRAAVIIGIMCAAPLLLTGYLWFTDPAFASVLNMHQGSGIEMVIMMGCSFLAATYGTYMINSLRNEAFEARQLGQYRLCRRIGSGGMGDVYLAEHQMMKRPCAIKLIRPGKAADPQALARFEREVRATAKLSHWNTIEIFDYGRTEDGTFYYVMEYLPGLSLSDLVARHGPLPPARALHLLAQTCDALAEAHGHGLVHRDIKPGNIFSAQRGGVHDVAKLLDFGLAKPVSAGDSPVQLTQEGSITGSPLFMSPEQAVGDREPDARSDIYSLGAVAYFLLTGVAPFESNTTLKIILAHVQQKVVPPSQLRQEIPNDLEQVVLRCLAKEPADRYQDVRTLRRSLNECSVAGQWTGDDAERWWQTNGAEEMQLEAVACA